MSDGLNKVMLIGNLGKDPELKMTPGGQALVRFSLATTETWKTQSGEKKSKTEWHHIVLWGKRAEVATKFLKKGSKIMVEGKLEYTEFTGADNVKRTSTDIKCENFIMLDGKSSSTGDNLSPIEPNNKAATKEEASSFDSLFNDNEIPF